MLSIDAADLANGCIRFVEGSHLQGPVIHGSAPNAWRRNRRANTFAFDRAGNRIGGGAHRQALLLARP